MQAETDPKHGAATLQLVQTVGLALVTGMAAMIWTDASSTIDSTVDKLVEMQVKQAVIQTTQNEMRGDLVAILRRLNSIPYNIEITPNSQEGYP